VVTDEFQAALRRLSRDARDELRRLEEDKGRLVRLLTFIDDYLGDVKRPPKRRPRPRKHGQVSLIDEIKARPGIRTSMLAMVTSREPEELAEELTAYAEKGRIRREGLGWVALGQPE
jgi:hypothetical protein